jgi:hypothetical protein
MADGAAGSGRADSTAIRPQGEASDQVTVTAARLSPHLDGAHTPADGSATGHRVGDFVSQTGGGRRCCSPWQDEQPPSASQ